MRGAHRKLDAVLAGGGEMGALMRALDWSRTAVGPVSRWPQSLRTALSILLETGFPMYIAWGPEFTQFYNDGYRPILGSTKHPAAMGISTRETFAEIWEIIGPMFERVMQGREVSLTDFLLPLDRHGFLEECYFIFSYSPIREESGRVGGVLVTVTETTERVLAARRLSMLQALSSGMQGARTAEGACETAARVIAQSPGDIPFALVYLLDADGRSARLAGTAGIAPGTQASPQVVDLSTGGDAPWPLSAVADKGAPVLVDPLGPAFGPLPARKGISAEPPARALALPIARPGEQRPVGVLVAAVSLHLMLDARYRSFLGLVAGQVRTAIASARAFEEAKARVEALAEIDRVKTTFFSNISHEFRTPLTLMLGPTEDALASEAAALGGEQLRVVHRQGLRLLKLVNALLDFARIEAGRAEASYQPVDLAALTIDLASAFRSAIERAGLRFEVDCPPLPEPMFVDPEMWEKIVLNLISNAFKFTFEGGITVTLRWREDHAELSVRDTGTGIPDHELPRLFERFHRVQGARARTYEGSGIGLALVSELCRLHGGTVRVHSEVDRGTVFTVSIPRGSAHLPADRIRAARDLESTATGAAPYVEEALRWVSDGLPDDTGVAPRPAATDVTRPGVQGGAHILLADDNADMRDYIRRLLEARWTVDMAADGAEALARARRRRPDLVLTDIMMPNVDGFALLRALRADPDLRNVPVILLSARAGEESRAGGLEAGADDYLVKPFSGRELLARVSTHLQIAGLRREAERAREKLELLFIQAPVAVAVVTGPDLRFHLANPAHCDMVGRSDLVGKTLREAFPEIGEHELIKTTEHVYRTGEPLRISELNVPIRRNGVEADAFFNYTAQPLRDATGAIIGVMGVATEVTEQVLARSRIEALRAEAEAAHRAKDEFLAMLGHELRNPLAPIVTALELMRSRHGAFAERERSVIERQVAHLTRLVDDLLDVARITRGKVELTRGRIELCDAVADAIETASPLVEERRHHLTVSVPARGLSIEGDSVRIAQAIANLLTNAAKYTESGGHIAVTAARRGDRAVLAVQDDGTGISPDMLPRVFDLFVQGYQGRDRSRGGLGLGLSIVKNIVALHGGRVSVHSEGRGRGSTFTIELPIAESSETPAEDKGRAGLQPATGPAGPACARRVLIVDDNQDAADLLADSLTALGHTTAVAYDGPEALNVAAAFQPDVALLDIGLPVIDGYELARRLRQDPGLRHVCLVAVTGYGQESDRALSRAAGFDAHLVKPLTFDALETLLSELRASPSRRP